MILDAFAPGRILYGGSVTAANCRELAACPDIDGDVFSPFCQKDSSLNIEQYCPDINGDYVFHHFVKKIHRFILDNIALILTVILFFTIL